MSLPAAKTELTVVMTSLICDLASSPFQIAFQNSESDPYAADTVTGIVVLLPASMLMDDDSSRLCLLKVGVSVAIS